MQYLQSRIQWPAVDEFLALRAAPSSNFRIQDDLPFEAAPTSRELPDTEAQGQVAEIVTPPIDLSGAMTSPTSSESPASSPTAPNPPGWSADAILPPEYAPMQPGVAPAAMLIASPDNPQKPISNLGSAVWSTIPPAPGQPATVAVKVEADIPDLKMHATMILRKNTDPTLQAAHTIDLKFSFADGAPIAGFKDIGLPQMRMQDSTASEALTSVKFKVTDVSFLIALPVSRFSARNLDLMPTRAWIDFPLLLNDNRTAKLVFQKSAAGQEMLEKALDAWGDTRAGAPLQTAELPQYKFAREVEHLPVTGGNAESRYLTTVFGMIKSHLRETPELHVDSANKRGVVDFYVDKGGHLVGRKLISSSGSPNLDTAVMTAIAEAAPYPAPPNRRALYLNYNFGKR